MNSNRCMQQALSYYQPQHGPPTAYAGSQSGNVGVVMPKAKLGVAVELDLGTGYLKLADCCGQRSNRADTLSQTELVEILRACFGSRKDRARAVNSSAQWQAFVAQLRKYLFDEEPADPEDCAQKLAEIRAKGLDLATQLKSDLGASHCEVIKIGNVLEQLCR